MVIDAVLREGKYVIYGAQVVAYGTRVAIEQLTGIKPECFTVGRTAGNPDLIDGIPVEPIERVDKDTLIIVGVTELIQQEVVPYLKRNGYKNYYVLTHHEEHLLMSRYYEVTDRFPLAD